MPTIRDVAKQAEVSTATVSATLNNSAYVSPDLKARVLAAVEALGYAPSGIAKSLKTGKTRLLALVVADVLNPFFTSLIDAVETAAYDWGYSLMLCNSDENFERERHHLQLIRAQRCDGLLLSPAGDSQAYRRRAFIVSDADRADRSRPRLLAGRFGWARQRLGRYAGNELYSRPRTSPHWDDLRAIACLDGADRLAGFLKALGARGVHAQPGLRPAPEAIARTSPSPLCARCWRCPSRQPPSMSPTTPC